MSYDYQRERGALFTEAGQRDFLKARDTVFRLLKTSGACRAGDVMAAVGSGDTWTMLASLDRMVELEEIVELQYPSGRPAGQDRVFVRGKP